MQIHHVLIEYKVPKVKYDWNFSDLWQKQVSFNPFNCILLCFKLLPRCPRAGEIRNGQHILPPTADAVHSHCLPILP